MQFLKLILRNALRHKLRTALTVLGLVVAILAFGLLQTVVDAWYAGADSAAPTRLVTRNAISLVFPLPISYRDKIRAVDGVRAVSYANWFGGIYQDPKNFFPQFAVEPRTYFDMYPEFRVPPDEFAAFLRDRKGAVIGRKLADTHGLKIGDVMPLRGTIFPGTWEFTVRAIYDGAEAKTDTSQMFFHWDYLNESVKKRSRNRADQVGIYLVDVVRRRSRGRGEPRDRRAVQELARRDAHRDRAGVPDRLREADRGARGRDPPRVLRRDRDHPRGDGQHHGDDRARAAGGVRDAQGARLRARPTSPRSFSASRSRSRRSARPSASR